MSKSQLTNTFLFVCSFNVTLNFNSFANISSDRDARARKGLWLIHIYE
ncbi:hypothetical protein CTDIVETGP_2269 [Clostridium tyrobutyricum DIVETGP]|uniref:Uncharacterized protein n=1 Tax=Clostridium tyrobutyricum DIVETGP TaxID=1408889 RepID=W6N9L3_CLOTY|nr:hypothetical protein CTDIVETGP_2269 [Clostridium tyrobutyricum DIVETGP]